MVGHGNMVLKLSYMVHKLSYAVLNPIPGGVFHVRSPGGGGKFAPTFYFLIMHVMSMKIGMDVFHYLLF